jgi:hypothetical protein
MAGFQVIIYGRFWVITEEDIREKWFPNLVFDSLRAVEDRLVEALATLENDPQRVAQIAGFDWIISIPMKAA